MAILSEEVRFIQNLYIIDFDALYGNPFRGDCNESTSDRPFVNAGRSC